MTQVVTELVIRADGALGTLDRFNGKMEQAGQATDRGVGALSRYEAASEKIRAAQERGLAVTTLSADRVDKHQRAYERFQATVNPIMDLRIKQEREAERAAISSANAVALGYATQEQALANVIALERRHATQMQAITDQQQRAASGALGLAAANDNLAQSALRAASANNVAQGSTANIAAQFQDIGVTAAMGMNPIMIALQQGTQLSSVLNTMKNPIAGLTSAFISLINPVSLLTIGFVAAAAAAIQFFTSSNDNAKSSIDTLKKYNDQLDTLLKGYEAAREAAQAPLDASARRPEASLASDLSLFQKDALAAYEVKLNAVLAKQTEWSDTINQMASSGAPADLVVQMTRVVDIVTEAGLSTKTTAAQFDALDTALTLIKNSGADDNVRYIAEEMLSLIRQGRDAKSIVDSLGASLQALPSTIETTINVRMNAFGEAQAQLADLMPDFRDRYTRMRDEAGEAFEAMRANATDAILRTKAETDYEAVLAGIDRLQAEDAASKASRSVGRQSEAEQMVESYRNLTQGAQQFIDQQRLEAQTLGMTSQAAAALRYEQDLLNKAANDNIALSPAQREELSSLAAAMAQVEERTRSLTEWYNFGRQTFGSFMADFRRDLMKGTSLWESFGNAAGKALDSIADRALSMAANGLFDMIFGAIMGGFGGVGATGGTWKGGLWGSAIFNAKGNVFDSPGLSAYSNKVYDTPQMFAFAKGAGVFAEAGPEAIMPLGRDSQGRLGVRSAPANQNFSAGGDTYGDLTIQNSMQIMPGATEEDGAAFARGFTREMNRQGPDFFKKWQKNDLRRAS